MAKVESHDHPRLQKRLGNVVFQLGTLLPQIILGFC